MTVTREYLPQVEAMTAVTTNISNVIQVVNLQTYTSTIKSEIHFNELLDDLAIGLTSWNPNRDKLINIVS